MIDVYCVYRSGVLYKRCSKYLRKKCVGTSFCLEKDSDTKSALW